MFDEEAIEVFEKIRDGGVPHTRIKLAEIFEFDAALAYQGERSDGVHNEVFWAESGGFSAPMLTDKQHYALFGKGEPVGEQLAS